MKIELTHADIEQLTEGAAQFGRAAIRATTEEGVPVWLTLNGREKSKQRARRAGAHLGEPPAGGEATAADGRERTASASQNAGGS